MKHPRTLLLLPAMAVLALSITTSSRALAQETTTVRSGGAGLGLGYAAMLTGPSGLSLAYDFGRFHIDTMLDVWSHDETALAFGVRGWLHLHSAAAADFSIGGGLGVSQDSPGDDDNDIVHFEAGFLIRAFVTSNVALSAFGGLGIRTGDVAPSQAEWELDAQPLAGIGLTYYFH